MRRLLYPLCILAPLLATMPAQAAGLPVALANEVETGFSQDTLDKAYANWNSIYLEGAHRFGERHSLYGEVRETHRFNLYDREISAGYYYPLSDSWTMLLEASASPEHHVLPRKAWFGQMQKAFAGGWDVQAGLRRSLYNTASTDVMVLTGERYWGSYRAAYTLYLGRLQGSGTAPSHLAQLSYYYGQRSSLTLGFAKGRQVENLGTGLGLLLTDVTSTSLSGRHWLDTDWGLSYEAIMEHQGNLYTRKGIRFGLRHAF